MYKTIKQPILIDDQVLILDKEIKINVDEYTEKSENEIKKRILGYIEWYKGHNPICYASELSLYSEDLPFSGTADFIGYIRKTEELVIIDYKTGNEYKSHQIQLNGYRMLWNALFPSHPIDAMVGERSPHSHLRNTRLTKIWCGTLTIYGNGLMRMSKVLQNQSLLDNFQILIN